jgi:hypothetical protein
MSADGNTMDTEDFLASLNVAVPAAGTAGGSLSGCSCVADGSIFTTGDTSPFRVVTQEYGKGIVNYNDICTADGDIYIELDYSTPACISCSSVDGYCGAAEALAANDLNVTYHVYASLE